MFFFDKTAFSGDKRNYKDYSKADRSRNPINKNYLVVLQLIGHTI